MSDGIRQSVFRRRVLQVKEEDMNFITCMKAAVVIIAAAGVLIGLYCTWRDINEDY